MNAYPTDDDLAKAVQNGDPAAEEEFYSRFRIRLIKYAVGKGFNYADADELAQDALARGLLGVASFVRGTSLLRWLAGIERNLMRRRWEAQQSAAAEVSLEDEMERGRQFQPGEKTEPTPAEAQNAARLWADVHLQMALAPNQREMDAVQLRYLDGLAYRDIEDALGLGKNSAKVYVQRGLRWLKARIALTAPDEPSAAERRGSDE